MDWHWRWVSVTCEDLHWITRWRCSPTVPLLTFSYIPLHCQHSPSHHKLWALSNESSSPGQYKQWVFQLGGGGVSECWPPTDEMRGSVPVLLGGRIWLQNVQCTSHFSIKAGSNRSNTINSSPSHLVTLYIHYSTQFGPLAFFSSTWYSIRLSVVAKYSNQQTE